MEALQLQSLRPALEAWVESFRPCFKRDVTFEYFQHYLLGLLADLKRKSIEPIALAAGVPVRTLQELLSMFAWDHARLARMLVAHVADAHGAGGIGVIDATGHPKRGNKTPGVHRQYCGETGKLDNCVVAQHLLFTDDHPTNPFSCMLASDLYLPAAWSDDRPRCRAAGIPEECVYRPKWLIALEQVKSVLAGGVRLNWVVFDEDYGRIPAFWFGLDAMGQRAVGEVPPDFRAWAKRPACTSAGAACHAARRADNLVTYSPAFTSTPWKHCLIKDTTRGELVWAYKAQRVHLSDSSHPNHNISVPTDRMYWLIVMKQEKTGEVKYLLSNAGANVSPGDLIRVLLSRWQVEKWFERAKQEAGLGAFEVRTYTGLMRHWLSVAVAMCFLSEQTLRLRGEKSAHHLRAGGRGDGDAGGPDLAARLPLVA